MEAECADGMLQSVYLIPDADKTRRLPTSIHPMAVHRP
jgi:hypothetical protein